MKHTKTVLLIDGDPLVYRAALGAQTSLRWDTDVYTVTADLRAAVAELDNLVTSMMLRLRAQSARIFLSDPKANWRKLILPSYKSTRGDKQKPILFHQLRNHLEHEWSAEWIPTLEADDLMGLFGTGSTVKGRRIICSLDKDLQQVPGYLFNPQKPERGVVSITEAEADRYHLVQTLTGDIVDGYKGLPGCGPVKAAKILGTSVGAEAWQKIVAAFEKAGLTAEDALVQARVARILRAGEYTRGREGTPVGTEMNQFDLKDSGAREGFTTGSVRDTRAGKGRYDLIPVLAYRRLAALYEAGALKYGDRNWEKGQPLSRYLDSAQRHLVAVMAGDRSEDHAFQAIWNLVGYEWTREAVLGGRLPRSLDDVGATTWPKKGDPHPPSPDCSCVFCRERFTDPNAVAINIPMPTPQGGV